MRARLLVLTLVIAAPRVLDAQSVAAVPVATVADFAWLEGTWEGRVPGGTFVAEAIYNAPKDGLIDGMMRLTDKGKVLMVEFISIVDSPTGPELRFRHFTPQLEVREVDFRQNFRLVKHSAELDQFDNAVPFDKALLSTQARNAMYVRHGNDEYVAHSDVIDENGKADVIEVTYRRKN